MEIKYTNNSTNFKMPFLLEDIIEDGGSWLCTHNNITYQTALLYNKETIIPGISRSSILRIGILDIETPTKGLQYYNVLSANIKYTDSGDTPYYEVKADIGRPIAMSVILTPVKHYTIDRDKLALMPPEEKEILYLEYKPQKDPTKDNLVIDRNYKRNYYNKHIVLDIERFNSKIRVKSLLDTIEYNIDKMLLDSSILIHHYANTNSRLQIIAIVNTELYTILTRNGVEPGIISTSTYDVMCIITKKIVTEYDLCLMPMLYDDKQMASIIERARDGEIWPLYSNVTFRLYNINSLIPKPILPEPEIIDPNKEEIQDNVLDNNVVEGEDILDNTESGIATPDLLPEFTEDNTIEQEDIETDNNTEENVPSIDNTDTPTILPEVDTEEIPNMDNGDSIVEDTNVDIEVLPDTDISTDNIDTPEQNNNITDTNTEIKQEDSNVDNNITEDTTNQPTTEENTTEENKDTSITTPIQPDVNMDNSVTEEPLQDKEDIPEDGAPIVNIKPIPDVSTDDTTNTQDNTVKESIDKQDIIIDNVTTENTGADSVATDTTVEPTTNPLSDAIATDYTI